MRMLDDDSSDDENDGEVEQSEAAPAPAAASVNEPASEPEAGEEEAESLVGTRSCNCYPAVGAADVTEAEVILIF